MELLTISGSRVIISPYALTVAEFKAIWEKYPTTAKDDALQELSFVYFMCDYKSPYIQYPEELRPTKIITDVLVDKTWRPDGAVAAAMLKYEELQNTPSMGMLKAATRAVNQVEKFFNNVDVMDDPKGTKITQLMAAVGKIGDTLKGFNAMMLQVQNEQTTLTRIRGGANNRVGSREVPKDKRQQA